MGLLRSWWRCTSALVQFSLWYALLGQRAAGQQIDEQQGGRSLASLIEREQDTVKGHLSTIQDWCHKQLATEAGEREKLAVLRDQLAPLVGQEEQVRKLEEQERHLAGLLHEHDLNVTATAKARAHATQVAEDLGKQVAALQRTHEGLDGRCQRKGGAFLGKDGQHVTSVVRALLERGREEVSRAEGDRQRLPELSTLQDKGQQLDQKHHDAVARLTHVRGQRAAAQSGMELVQKALSDQDQFLADLQSICRVAPEVYGRLESQLLPSLRNTTAQLAALTDKAHAMAAEGLPDPALKQQEQVATAAPPPAVTAAPRHDATPHSVPVVAAVHEEEAAADTAVPPPPPAPATVPRVQALPQHSTVADHPGVGSTSGASDEQAAVPPPQQQQQPLQLHEQRQQQEQQEEEVSARPAAPAALVPVSRHQGEHHHHEGSSHADEAEADLAADGLDSKSGAEGASTGTATGRNEAAATRADAAAVAAPPRQEEPPAVAAPAQPTAEQPISADRPLESSMSGTHGGLDPEESGWRSLLKKKAQLYRAGVKRKAFKSPNSDMMDLVQTPKTYTAWKPAHEKETSLTASTKSQLRAAEKAFDAPDDDDGKQLSFLQMASQAATAGCSGEEAARVLLEAYADVLGSSTLSQLSHAQLDLGAMRQLWDHVQALNSSSLAGGSHETQAVQWCAEFQREASAREEQAQVQRRMALLEDGRVENERRVANQRIKVQTQFLAAVERGSAALEQLRSAVSLARSAASLLGELHRSLAAIQVDSSAADRLALGRCYEALGRADGEMAAAGTEVDDIIAAAAETRAKAGGQWNKGLATARGALSALQLQAGSGAQTGGTTNGAGNADDAALRQHYDQMCQWTLGDAEVRRRLEANEKNAMQAALVVLSAGAQ